jgi:predicted nucleic-acid-binding protein
MARGTRARTQGDGGSIPGSVYVADTNVFIRYLTGTPKEQFERVRAYFDEAVPLILSDVVVAEIVYVLQSVYGHDRTAIADVVRSLVAEPSVSCERKSVILESADLYENSRLDWVDCFLVASVKPGGVTRVLSFDRGMDKIGGVRAEP